jgi:hypothetical protein
VYVFKLRRARRCVSVVAATAPVRHLSWAVGMHRDRELSAGQLQLIDRLCALISHAGETKHPPCTTISVRVLCFTRIASIRTLEPRPRGPRRPHGIVQQRPQFSTCAARRQPDCNQERRLSSRIPRPTFRRCTAVDYSAKCGAGATKLGFHMRHARDEE